MALKCQKPIICLGKFAEFLAQYTVFMFKGIVIRDVGILQIILKDVVSSISAACFMFLLKSVCERKFKNNLYDFFPVFGRRVMKKLY